MFFFRYLFLFFIIFYSQNVLANQKVMLGGKDFFISDDGTYELIKKTGSLIDIFNVEYLYFVKKKMVK
jgi:hypothetical protein